MQTIRCVCTRDYLSIGSASVVRQIWSELPEPLPNSWWLQTANCLAVTPHSVESLHQHMHAHICTLHTHAHSISLAQTQPHQHKRKHTHTTKLTHKKTHTHTHTNACTQTHASTHTITKTHTQTHYISLTHINTHIYQHKHPNSLSHIHTSSLCFTDKQTNAHYSTHTHTHAHKNTGVLSQGGDSWQIKSINQSRKMDRVPVAISHAAEIRRLGLEREAELAKHPSVPPSNQSATCTAVTCGDR